MKLRPAYLLHSEVGLQKILDVLHKISSIFLSFALKKCAMHDGDQCFNFCTDNFSVRHIYGQQGGLTNQGKQ